MDALDQEDACCSNPKSLLQLVQCPCCKKLPTPPVYGCQNGHIICESCKDKVEWCSVCRADKFNVRNLIVEGILKGKNLECPFCETPEFSGAELKEHVAVCPSRPVECNCKIGRKQCIAEMVPKDRYLNHMQCYHGLRETTDKGQITIKCPMSAGFVPQSFSAFNHNFMLHSARTDGKFFTWISYLGERSLDLHAEISLFYESVQHEPSLTEIKERAELKSATSIVPLSAHLTPDQVLKSGHCLEVTDDANHNNLPPYVWPGLEVQTGSVPSWGYNIKMWQPTRERSNYSRRRRTHAWGSFYQPEDPLHPNQYQYEEEDYGYDDLAEQQRAQLYQAWFEAHAHAHPPPPPPTGPPPANTNNQAGSNANTQPPTNANVPPVQNETVPPPNVVGAFSFGTAQPVTNADDGLSDEDDPHSPLAKRSRSAQSLEPESDAE